MCEQAVIVAPYYIPTGFISSCNIYTVFMFHVMFFVAQIKFLRSILELIKLNHQRNTTIREKVKVEHIVDEIQSYQTNWLQQVKRMEHARIPRMALEYKPKGKRDIDRPKTRWGDEQYQDEFSQDRTRMSYICLSS
jgi:hypothetical protein